MKIMKKNKGHRAYICGRAEDSEYHLHFLQLENWKKLKNSILLNLQWGKAVRK